MAEISNAQKLEIVGKYMRTPEGREKLIRLVMKQVDLNSEGIVELVGLVAKAGVCVDLAKADKEVTKHSDGCQKG